MWSKGRIWGKRLLIYTATFLFGFGIGVLGCRFHLRSYLWMGAVGEHFMAEQFAYTQYKEASYEEAARAMAAYISYLNQLKPLRSSWFPGQNPWLDSRSDCFDKMLTYGRLALLHERNNNVAAGDRAWARAEALAAELKWKDPFRRALRNRIERLDRE